MNPYKKNLAKNPWWAGRKVKTICVTEIKRYTVFHGTELLNFLSLEIIYSQSIIDSENYS